jgi:hypothetical protein
MAVPGLDPGIVPAIYVFWLQAHKKDVDARGDTPPRDAAGCLRAGMTLERGIDRSSDDGRLLLR